MSSAAIHANTLSIHTRIPHIFHVGVIPAGSFRFVDSISKSVRPISIRLRRGSAIAASSRLRQRKLMEELLQLDCLL